jgi:hypothetical protein
VAIFRDRPELHIARRLQRRMRWVGTKLPPAIQTQTTHIGAEVLVGQTSTAQTTHIGAEVLVSYPLPTITTKFVSHIFEDYV